MCHCYNTCLNSFNISSLVSDGIIISSTFLEFSSITGFCFRTLSAILIIKNLPVASAALWNTFLEAVFKASNCVSNNCFLYLLEKIIAIDKNPYSLTYFIVLGSIKYYIISIY